MFSKSCSNYTTITQKNAYLCDPQLRRDTYHLELILYSVKLVHLRGLEVDVVEYMQLPVKTLPDSLPQANEAPLVAQRFEKCLIIENLDIHKV